MQARENFPLLLVEALDFALKSLPRRSVANVHTRAARNNLARQTAKLQPVCNRARQEAATKGWGTLRNGQRLIPFLRQIFLSTVVHTPKRAAASSTGRSNESLTLLNSSSSRSRPSIPGRRLVNGEVLANAASPHLRPRGCLVAQMQDE